MVVSRLDLGGSWEWGLLRIWRCWVGHLINIQHAYCISLTMDYYRIPAQHLFTGFYATWFQYNFTNVKSHYSLTKRGVTILDVVRFNGQKCTIIIDATKQKDHHPLDEIMFSFLNISTLHRHWFPQHYSNTASFCTRKPTIQTNDGGATLIHWHGSSEDI